MDHKPIVLKTVTTNQESETHQKLVNTEYESLIKHGHKILKVKHITEIYYK